MIELRHLRYFVAVAEELNFSRAAQRLHMAQPPLSVAIRQLEQELGAELLERTTREVTLTDAGRTLLDGTRRIFAELDHTVTSTRRAAAGELGTLRVAFSWGTRFETLPAIGQAFRAHHPDVSLLTEEMWNSRMPQALRSAQVDIAVGLCPEVSGELSYETVRTEPAIALVTAAHPLAGESETTLAALADEEFLLFPRDLAPRLYDLIVSFCRRAGFEPQLAHGSFHTDWSLQLLADQQVVAVVPESVTRALPPGIAAVGLTGEAGIFETVLVWRGEHGSAVRDGFRRAARELYQAVR
jgi:DNA-binding transcriptional LysR family regulator